MKNTRCVYIFSLENTEDKDVILDAYENFPSLKNLNTSLYSYFEYDVDDDGLLTESEYLHIFESYSNNIKNIKIETVDFTFWINKKKLIEN